MVSSSRTAAACHRTATMLTGGNAWLQVRSPSGLLSFDGVLDRDGEPIPAPESLGESAEGDTLLALDLPLSMSAP